MDDINEAELFGGATQDQEQLALESTQMLEPTQVLEGARAGNTTNDAPTGALMESTMGTTDAELMDDLFGQHDPTADPCVNAVALSDTALSVQEDTMEPQLIDEASSQIELVKTQETALEHNNLLQEVMQEVEQENENLFGEEDDLFGEGDRVTTAEKEIMDDLFGEGGVQEDEDEEMDQLMDRPYEEVKQGKPATYPRPADDADGPVKQVRRGAKYDAADSDGEEPTGPQPEIADLFGSEDEEEDDVLGAPVEKRDEKKKTGASGGKVKAEPRKVKEEPVEGNENRDQNRQDGEGEFGSEDELEDEERDLFGELSEDDEVEDRKGKPEEHKVRKRLLPDGEVFLFKIPNTLAMETQQYHPESLDENAGGFRERVNANDRPIVELCGPENTIRWRLKRNPDTGEVIMDDNGEGEFESNAKFIEWEDGTVSLQVGDELFQCSSIPEPRSQLYVEEEDDLFVFHKPLTKQMQVIPAGITANTHRRLLSSQINKVRTHRTVKPISTMQAKKQTMEQEAEAIEAVRRAQEKAAAGFGHGGKKRQAMDASYLESDEFAEGPSLKALKKNPLASDDFLFRAAQTLR